jgi:hypothetical protein
MRGRVNSTVSSLAMVALAVSLSACSTGNYYTETPVEIPQSQVAAADVTCAPLGNRGGFHVEFPPCACNHGITLSWVGRHPANREGWTGFVLRRGYLSDVVPEVLVASSDGRQVERVLVRDEETYAWTELKRDDNGYEWQRNQALFTEIMQEFGPRLHEFDMYCRAKEVSRPSDREATQQASLGNHPG